MSQTRGLTATSAYPLFAVRWALTRRRVGTLASIALAFSPGVAASQTHGHYARQFDCQRWRSNVGRWTQVVANATAELRPAETTALMLAHGAMIAVRAQACGY